MARYGKGLLLLAAVALVGCGSDNDIATAEDSPKSDFRALFSASDGVIPFPSNLLFRGSLDGTLNLPPDVDSAPQDGVLDAHSPPREWLNALNGFSTIAPMSTGFASAIDATSIPGNVRLFEVTTTSLTDPLPLAVTSIVAELQFGVDFVASPSSTAGGESSLVIVPLKPLKPSTGYMVAITRGLKNSAGDTALPDNQYRLAQRTSPLTATEFPSLNVDPDGDNVTDLDTLNGLRLLVNAQEGALAAANPPLPSSQVAVSWSFTTQSVGVSLGAIRNVIEAAPVPASALVDSGINSPVFGIADVYSGTLTTSLYLAAASNPQDSAPLTTPWQSSIAVGGANHVTGQNPLPAATNAALQIPLLATVPNNATMPAEGWPVVIFEHGIFGNRAQMLAISDALAGAGFAAVAIDMPLHGIRGDEPQIGALRMPGLERTFDLDVLNNTTGAPIDFVGGELPDGIDNSGSHFINLKNMLVSRDNVRQSVVDLMTLTRALSGMNAGANTFDADRIMFVGHSLGSIVGTIFLANQPSVKAAVLSAPGGGIAKLLDGSEFFGPTLAAGLASAAGLQRGSSDYESFISAAQAALDTADPINHGAAAVSNRGLLLLEINGDKLIPNNVTTAAPEGVLPSPTAGTDPLVGVMGLTQVSASTGDGATLLKAVVRFTEGHHSSIWRPDEELPPANSPTLEELAATAEMQAEMVGFLTSNGTLLTITNTTVVE